jgi:hypothetical protein
MVTVAGDAAGAKRGACLPSDTVSSARQTPSCKRWGCVVQLPNRKSAAVPIKRKDLVFIVDVFLCKDTMAFNLHRTKVWWSTNLFPAFFIDLYKKKHPVVIRMFLQKF